jgi:hypothetical protein
MLSSFVGQLYGVLGDSLPFSPEPTGFGRRRRRRGRR